MYVCVYLIYSDETLPKNIPVALNPLNANGKSKAESSHQMSTTVEGLYMTSDIGNKKPPPSYKPLQSTPQNVRYVMTTYVHMYVNHVCTLSIPSVLKVMLFVL